VEDPLVLFPVGCALVVFIAEVFRTTSIPLPQRIRL
jgi:hypothetical protein